MGKQPVQKERIAPLDPREVTEVAEYMIADQELTEFLEDFKTRHPGTLETLEELAARRNAGLEAAQKAVRSRQAPCGPFEVHQIATIYDAEALYDAVGEAQFLTIGGSIQMVRELKLDGKRFDAAVMFKKLPTDLVAAVRKRRVSFKDIRKIWAP